MRETVVDLYLAWTQRSGQKSLGGFWSWLQESCAPPLDLAMGEEEFDLISNLADASEDEREAVLMSQIWP